ncbi:CDA_G0030000.mRNA.1.CDS.1 [Saccharomyces cerevisiae]|nr:CDA_G0030000.mRNA.1.CDS.1 [Saccharomyces cerevisiae]CAI7363103.1 CDA_G0030000.mRNA.1.CDS.1 [Saccharomyces cerevisiae]
MVNTPVGRIVSFQVRFKLVLIWKMTVWLVGSIRVAAASATIELCSTVIIEITGQLSRIMRAADTVLQFCARNHTFHMKFSRAQFETQFEQPTIYGAQ